MRAVMLLMALVVSTRGDALLRDLRAQEARWRRIVELSTTVRAKREGLRLLQKEQSQLVDRLNFLARRLELAERKTGAKERNIRSLVRRGLVEAGPFWEGEPSALVPVFSAISGRAHEVQLDREAIRSIRNEFRGIKELLKDVRRSIASLRTELEELETKLVRLREEAWREGRQLMAHRSRFGAEHLRVVASIGRLRRRLNRTAEAWTLPARGWRIASRDGAMLLSVASGAVVRAPQQGTVLYAGHVDGRGEGVVLLHPDGTYTVILELATVSVTDGTTVHKDDVLGMAPFVPEGTNVRPTIFVWHGRR